MISSTEICVRGYFCVNASGIAAKAIRFYHFKLKSGSNAGSNLAYAGWRIAGGVIKWSLIAMNGAGLALSYSASSPALNR